jgi:hypothetical protein
MTKYEQDGTVEQYWLKGRERSSLCEEQPVQVPIQTPHGLLEYVEVVLNSDTSNTQLVQPKHCF